ncbi:MAG: repeat-containing protein [Bacteroidetes bacterium]|nr:repeat-containing protein [Bacteroidota bacterium]
MKSKFLLAFLACCLFTGKLSAQLCYASFSYSQNPGSTTVTFYVDSSSAGFLNYPVYTWSFGDGTAGFSSQTSHSYNSLGPYTVCLTMNDTTNHCTFTTCDTVRLSGGSNCSTTISYTNVDSVYTFTASNSGTAPFTYSWTVNGQNASTSASPTITLPPSNFLSYNVCVSVSDNNGCVATDCTVVFDSSQNTASCNTFASVSNQDSLYTFTASHLGGTPVSYSWYYNNTLLGTTASVSTILTAADLAAGGSVCVTIADANGCTSTDCVTLRSPSGGGGCQAYFVIYPDSSNGNLGYYLGYNYSSGSFGTNVLWDFGDGSTSTNPYPSHTYATPGQYTVCLTVGTPGTTCYDTYCDSSFYAYKTASGLMTHLSISGATGINEASANTAISIYPNPVNDKLTISTKGNIDNERIFNMGGQLVFERKSGNEINVSKFSTGIYILELSSNGATSRTKFVKE